MPGRKCGSSLEVSSVKPEHAGSSREDQKNKRGSVKAVPKMLMYPKRQIILFDNKKKGKIIR